MGPATEVFKNAFFCAKKWDFCTDAIPYSFTTHVN